MKFRPCIDIHNGRVKQIVGSSIQDKGDFAKENFVSSRDAASYAALYRRDGLFGGHIILLNQRESAYYKKDVEQAKAALKAFPGGLQVGGGITAENAVSFLEAGASHVILTSYVFREGKIQYERLKELSRFVGKEHIVLDLSCRRRGMDYYIVTDRWQRFTEEKLSSQMLDLLAPWCDEFLVHAVDVEGKTAGIERGVLEILAQWAKKPVTYAGGVCSMEDMEAIERIGKGKIDATVGSALDLFGGGLSYQRICEKYSDTEKK